MSKMKTKYFFKTSFDSLFFQAVIIAAFVGCIYIIIKITKVVFIDMPPSERWKGILIYALFTLSLPMFAYYESTFFIGIVLLDDKRILSRGDNRFKKEKIQYPASVEYKDIIEISILPLKKNSRGEYLRLTRPIPYLCIKTKSGKWKNFSLHFMSRMTVKHLLKELKRRCVSANNMVPMDLDRLMIDFSNSRWSTK